MSVLLLTSVVTDDGLDIPSYLRRPFPDAPPEQAPACNVIHLDPILERQREIERLRRQDKLERQARRLAKMRAIRAERAAYASIPASKRIWDFSICQWRERGEHEHQRPHL